MANETNDNERVTLSISLPLSDYERMCELHHSVNGYHNQYVSDEISHSEYRRLADEITIEFAMIAYRNLANLIRDDQKGVNYAND